MNLKAHLKDGLLVLTGIALLAVGVHDLIQKLRGNHEPCDSVLVSELPDDVTAQVVMHDGTLTEVTHKGVNRTYMPSAGKATLTVNDSGGLTVDVKNKGWSTEAGGSVLFADRFRFGLDLQVFYWSHIGVHVGMALANAPIVLPFVAVSYRLNALHLANSSIMVGASVRKDPIVGLRVEF